jgi:hypothetical protein
MSFQAYIDNIKAKTGKSPDDFKKLAEQKGFLENGELRPTVKAGQIVDWLKKDFQLGHGHAMAIYTVFKKLKQTIMVNGETKFTDKKAVEKPKKKSGK